MNRIERRAAAVFLVIAAGAAVMAMDIGFGNFMVPGPGFFPFWLAVLMAAVGLLYYCRSRTADTAPTWAPGALTRPALAVILVLVFIGIIDSLGFCTDALFLLAAWLGIIEKKPWKVVSMVAVAGTALLYLIFVQILQLPLPRGLLL
ncbi:MAG: tripartite tricarboxylate transporter TctB family protein [Negativicutes bacterium]|nr:tripartite tricarboxylate transporter TctB family protein [Negativicutes bacterium]